MTAKEIINVLENVHDETDIRILDPETEDQSYGILKIGYLECGSLGFIVDIDDEIVF